MKIQLIADPTGVKMFEKTPRFYSGFSSKLGQPMWSFQAWAALKFDSLEQATVCSRQLQLLGFSVRVVE